MTLAYTEPESQDAVAEKASNLWDRLVEFFREQEKGLRQAPNHPTPHEGKEVGQEERDELLPARPSQRVSWVIRRFWDKDDVGLATSQVRAMFAWGTLSRESI